MQKREQNVVGNPIKTFKCESVDRSFNIIYVLSTIVKMQHSFFCTCLTHFIFSVIRCLCFLAAEFFSKEGDYLQKSK